MRYYLSLILLSTCLFATAQIPVINGLDKYSTTVGETVFINGSNFPTNAANVKVNFGAGVANVVSTSANQIEVTVPSTATYGPVVVTDLTTGLSGASGRYFTMSFGGGTFSTAATDARVDFPTGQQYTYDLCNCDFDGDGRLDVAIANNNSQSINIFLNTSTTATTSFTSIPVNIGFQTISAVCSDLNGDNKPDLVLATNLGSAVQHIYPFQNSSSVGSISFDALPKMRLANLPNDDNRVPRQVRISDVNLDGKKDLLVGNESDNTLFIYENTSTLTTASFNNTPIQVTVTGSRQCGTFDVGDLNNDGLPDLVVTPFNASNENVYILKNQSTTDEIKFSSASTIVRPGQRTSVVIADFDGDSYNDLATTSVSSQVFFFKNTTSGSDISFDANTLTLSGVNIPFSLELGDLNGDGKVDLGAASRNSGVYVIENNSTSSAFSFTASNIPTDQGLRNIQIADYNGDAKPDLGLVHLSEPTSPGQFSVIANRNCITPSIAPANLTFCTGAANAFILEATNSINATYDWSFSAGGNLVSQSGNEATVFVDDGTTSVDITVTIEPDDGSCSTNTTETFTLTGGTPAPAPTISNSISGVICGGSTFILSGPASQDTYSWVLPDGSTASTEEITISNATSANAGDYTLRVIPNAGECFSQEASVTVSIDEPPTVSIANNGANQFCETSSVLLEAPNYSGFTYQWKQGGTDIPDANSNTYTASASGDYTVSLISVAGCENESLPIPLTVVAPPSGDIASNDEICVGAPLAFDASGTTGDATLSYSWDFGDGNNANTVNTNNTYATADTYTVTLTTGYSDVANCESTTTKDVLVSAVPSSEDILGLISPDPTTTEKCPEDELTLTLPSDYQSYEWSIGSTVISETNSASIGTQENQQSVNVNLNVITDVGCEVTGTTVTVSNYPNSGFTFSSPDATIVDDTIELEEVASSVRLEVSSGSDFTWAPADILSTSTGSSVTVYPKNEVSVITVTGTDDAGCSITSDITVITPGVIARKSFSPNGDGIGYDCWEILNSDRLNGCTIYILDQKGSYVLKADSPFSENCVWNGNLDNGNTQAPAGVYYYVLKCDNNSFSQTGTILLAR